MTVDKTVVLILRAVDTLDESMEPESCRPKEIPHSAESGLVARIAKPLPSNWCLLGSNRLKSTRGLTPASRTCTPCLCRRRDQLHC
jgi:hypothetical protein